MRTTWRRRPSNVPCGHATSGSRGRGSQLAYRIMRNLWIDTVRARGRRDRHEAPEDAAKDRRRSARGDARLDGTAACHVGDGAPAGRAARSRRAILIQGFGYREVSEMLDLPIGTFRAAWCADGCALHEMLLEMLMVDGENSRLAGRRAFSGEAARIEAEAAADPRLVAAWPRASRDDGRPSSRVRRGRDRARAGPDWQDPPHRRAAVSSIWPGSRTAREARGHHLRSGSRWQRLGGDPGVGVLTGDRLRAEFRARSGLKDGRLVASRRTRRGPPARLASVPAVRASDRAHVSRQVGHDLPHLRGGRRRVAWPAGKAEIGASGRCTSRRKGRRPTIAWRAVRTRS